MQIPRFTRNDTRAGSFQPPRKNSPFPKAALPLCYTGRVAALHVIVFARTPVPGRVKTRLIGRLTAEQAVALHQAMITDTAAVVAALPLPAERRILFTEAPPPMALSQDIEVGRQAEGDLGARLVAAIEGAFAGGAERAIVLGSDSPHLPPSRILEAVEALDTAELVLGPTDDGGYYLVGCRAGRFSPAVFAGVEWGSARVFQQTCAAAAAAGLSVASLAPWYDLDEWKDLMRFAREAAPAPRTRALLDALRSESADP